MHVTICHQSVAGHTRADELDVMTQVDAVEAALGNIGVRTSRLACGLDLAATARALKTSAPDVVFNLVESLEGHGELIAAFPGLLDALKIPYTGAPAEAPEGAGSAGRRLSPAPRGLAIAQRQSRAGDHRDHDGIESAGEGARRAGDRPLPVVTSGGDARGQASTALRSA